MIILILEQQTLGFTTVSHLLVIIFCGKDLYTYGNLNCLSGCIVSRSFHSSPNYANSYVINFLTYGSTNYSTVGAQYSFEMSNIAS